MLSYIGVQLVELNAELWVMTVLIVLLHQSQTRKADLPLWCLMLIKKPLFNRSVIIQIVLTYHQLLLLTWMTQRYMVPAAGAILQSVVPNYKDSPELVV